MFYEVKRKNSLKQDWGPALLLKELREFANILRSNKSDDIVRNNLLKKIQEEQLKSEYLDPADNIVHDIIARDCARALRGIIRNKNEKKANFSVFKILRKVARGEETDDISSAFYADITNIFWGLQRRTGISYMHKFVKQAKGREAAIARSDYLDIIGNFVENLMTRYPDGLQAEVIKRREKNKNRILKVLNASADDWYSYKWQFKNVIRNLKQAEKLISLSDEEKENIEYAEKNHIPFGITPYYASLMDYNLQNRFDSMIRAQVIPPKKYLEEMSKCSDKKACSFDFMLEHDTSPIDLITRRYPAISIFKPYNACPQICVYCQRNWEIEGPFASNALATKEKLNSAIAWLKKHNSIKEVLITGGDPLTLTDSVLKKILDKIADIDHIERIRIGSRIPVTVPMRITEKLADLLGSYRLPGRREVCLVTHVEHPYEITFDLINSVNLISMRGIPVYNQLVYTFYVSRRFEAAKLRMMLRLAGIDPYYTFLPKGKEETRNYRLPIARLMQEQQEETRLLPGLARTDEPVFNVPGQGKNYLRALQHRDLISVLPDGSRVYEFHPWEKQIASFDTYISKDVPILEYLQNLENIGEDVDDYETIWYYF